MSSLSYTDAEMAYKAGAVNPVLAKLYLSHGIRAEAMNHLAYQDRAGLCNDITHLIETADRATDREMAADILLSLLRHAETQLKQAVAERLSVLHQAPLRLILQFINDDIDVAKPVLTQSTALNDLDLLYIIQSRDSPFWQAIAERQNLGEHVVDTLVDMKDVATTQKLVENIDITFTDYALGKIAKMASDTDMLNDCLISRGHTSRGDFARRIYAYASDAVKEMMTEKLGTLSQDVADAMDDVMAEFIEATPHHFMPSGSMLKAAEMFMEQGKLNKILMLNTLKRGQIASFIAQFTKFSGLPLAVVVAMLQQKSGHSLAIACKANGIEKNEFFMIFNFTRKIMGEDYLSKAHVSSALVYYDRISPAAAKRLVLRSKH